MTVLAGAERCRCTPPSLKRMPSASSAEITRCRARALALGTLPLDPSQAVRQGREIEARSASSCCERPVRLRAARNMPPVISTIVMLRLFARRQRASMSVYFTNSLTPPSGLGLLASPRGGFRVGRRVARSLPERWPAVLPPARNSTVQGHQLAHNGGAARSLPLPRRRTGRRIMRAIGLVLLSITIMALLLTDADAQRRSSAQGSQTAGAKKSWCASYPSQGINDNCSYSSFDECWATMWGRGGFCRPNPFPGTAYGTGYTWGSGPMR